jgi:hypothetical protein
MAPNRPPKLSFNFKSGVGHTARTGHQAGRSPAVQQSPVIPSDAAVLTAEAAQPA